MSVITCPKCNCQLEVKLSFASGPRAPSSPTDDVGLLLEQAEDRNLNKWEQEFITSLRARYDEYGDRVMVSEKQMATLRNIASGESR